MALYTRGSLGIGISRAEPLASWNFRHLVNRIRRARINEVNVRHGYPTLEILAPPEV